MRYLNRQPRVPLREFVAELWLYSGYRPPHAFERILPTGTVEVVINLREQALCCYDLATFAVTEKVRGPLLSGPRAGYALVDTKQQAEIMGVHFHPGGAQALIGAPVEEIHAADIPLAQFWGGAAEELHDRLFAEKDAQRRFHILEQALFHRMQLATRPHHTIVSALRQLDGGETGVSVRELAERAGWSERHFSRTFRAQVGLTPKAYGRVRRFQAAVRRIREDKKADWAGFAVECGYFDQAHLIREFQTFCGMTPAAYAKAQQGYLVHVPVAEQAQILPVAS